MFPHFLFPDTALKLPSYLNALIVKSLTLLHSRRAAPKVPHPDNSERQPPLRCTALLDTLTEGGSNAGDALPDTDIIHCYHTVQW